MIRSLPQYSNLEHLQKQAKALRREAVEATISWKFESGETARHDSCWLCQDRRSSASRR